MVRFTEAPLQPTQRPEAEQSILLGRSAFEANIKIDHLRYNPIEDGGFELRGDTPYKFTLNRPIVHGRNIILTGDRPLFRIETSTGAGVYAGDRSYPLFPRKDAVSAQVRPVLGTLQLGVTDGKDTLWLQNARPGATVFRPGYTICRVSAPDGSWKGEVKIAPALDFHGFVCHVSFDKPVRLVWQYGGLYWAPGTEKKNRVQLKGNSAVLTAESLPKGVVYVGWNGSGSGKRVDGKYGKEVLFTADKPQTDYYIYGTWGVTGYDKAKAEKYMSRLDTPNSNRWPEARDRLKEKWFDCYIGRALNPDKNFRVLKKDPAAALKKTCAHWDARRKAFQVRTPDPYLNALVNFERAISDYHIMGPGLVLSSKEWVMYSHISVGWYGKMWGGDVQTIADYLRFFAAMQAPDGFINWISPSLHAYHAENNTPYWVDHLWWAWQWSADTNLIADLWPSVEKAVEWEQKNNDPDGDGLFQSFYEYWNCDSNGKGPKAVTPTATAWAMYDRAAKMAEILGKTDRAEAYRKKADFIRSQLMKELWNPKKGLLGSIGGNGIWRGHPQTWEEYIPILNGMLPLELGRSAMRWVEAHYSFHPGKDIDLLMNCDWWPLRWSVHWVPVGDTLLAAEAGMKCGDPDLWWPYFRTVILSAFRSDAPAVRFGISNTGSGSGGFEFIDSDDPHMQATIRGLFGITPDIPHGRISIAPTFPSDWKQAEIRTPNISYSWKREGNRVTFHITTPRPLVKQVAARPGAPFTTTACETDSVVTVELPPPPKAPEMPAWPKPVLAEENPPRPEPAVSDRDRARLVLLDLSKAYNTTLSRLVKETRFTADYGGPTTIESWWHTVPGHIGPGEETVTNSAGVVFLLRGRNDAAAGRGNNLLALSSWGKPYPLPAAATLSIGRKVEKVWLLMQNYVSPIKNYIPNGEVVLHYETGEPQVVSLVPPYNMDCYFQPFSREGTSIPLGELEWPNGWIPCPREFCKAQANALGIECDPKRVLESIEIRATVSEGVVGINAVTLLPAP